MHTGMRRMALRSAAFVMAFVTVLLQTSPSTAAGAAGFVGTAHVNCFGCGSSPGTATLTVTCVDLGPGGNPCIGTVYATFIAVEDNDPTTCVISGTATGSTTGVLVVSFNWTRVGAMAVITTNGDINGAGTAAFVITSPIGIPCRSAVDAEIAGWLAGA